MNESIQFFDNQFRIQSSGASLELNPFEQAALDFLHGEVLDFGAGLGNLSFAAAAKGCKVTALDASPAAVAHMKTRALAENLPVNAELADLRDYVLQADFDSVVAIGLLPYFDCATAFRILKELQAKVRPGGVAAVNVLVEGTTYLDMFASSGHCLFKTTALLSCFDGWEILFSQLSRYPAPRKTEKCFSTVIARKPKLLK
jgi:tellurite methyltransferase